VPKSISVSPDHRANPLVPEHEVELAFAAGIRSMPNSTSPIA
jgi:hypothetical protein